MALDGPKGAEPAPHRKLLEPKPKEVATPGPATPTPGTPAKPDEKGWKQKGAEEGSSGAQPRGYGQLAVGAGLAGLQVAKGQFIKGWMEKDEKGDPKHPYLARCAHIAHAAWDAGGLCAATYDAMVSDGSWPAAFE